MSLSSESSSASSGATPARIQHEIGYNSQRDNYSFGGRFSAWSQCFSTCAWMFLSFYSPRVEADNEAGLRWYVDEVEAQVGGRPGIAERVIRKFRWISGYTSLWWLVQKAGVEYVLRVHGVAGGGVFRESNGTAEEMSARLERGPVILGTSRLGGLRGGHIILVIGRESDANGRLQWIVHDPFGDANANYSRENGAAVRYDAEMLARYTENVTGRPGCIRYLFWDENA